MTTAGHEYEKAAPAVAPTADERPAPEQPLTVAGVSSDRARLLLEAADGATFTLEITPSLRAAVRGDANRSGSLETKMDSALRPRDIQARIRAGESPEAVADAARTTVEKIMPFVAPVLAERQHVAERAQRSNVRRRAGESGQGRTLGDAVAGHLRSLNVDPEAVAWDAWRREDGRWTLTAGFALPERTGGAHFTFDTPGNYVVLDDEDARWLVGEVVPSPAPARDDLRSVRERRLSSVPHDDELPLGDEVGDTAGDELGADAIELVSETPLEAFLDDTPASDDPELREEAEDAAASEVEPDQPTLDVEADAEPEPAPAPEPPARRPVQKKKGRASVPSWDEIMFGGSDQ